ncbi:GIY-YIG nuclease family protein [Pantoea sp. 1.19]|uniref:GIY-YIG nuclease family protein n=1 Tax=Pantoea sp. 1.19 TaxID=1925589 RepID=UPI000948C3CF|nr:GIY-YIG nuclease family protein [Pantoea sp. 1.19]
MSTLPPWQLYMIQTAAGALYTGISNDVIRRFRQHQRGTGARALRGKGPLLLQFSCPAGDRASASRLEYRVKQLSRAQKLQLIAEQPACVAEWLSQAG